jgi:aminoglycoside phosphotransferase (APT) family kinase protein
MNHQRMPGADVAIDTSLVRALLREQHADLASLPLAEAGEGWDNKLFRLGDGLVVRLPRRRVAAGLIEHEQRWLPVLAPNLPLPVPAPVRVGRPGCGFPWAWSIAPWFPGEPAADLATGHTETMALQLAEFLAALHRPAPVDAPSNPFRTSLPSRSDTFQERLQRCGRQVEQTSALLVWRASLEAPVWSGPAVWVHADVHPGNLLVNTGRLIAVIDFGDLTAGDPAVDLSVAWMLWPEGVRHAFRIAVGRTMPWVDEATWQRARGWAVSLGVAYLVHSLDNPVMMDIGRRTVAATIGDRNS